MREPSAGDANIAKLEKVAWRFSKRLLNPSYEAGLKTLPLRSCLIHDNSEISIREIKTVPKWITTLNYSEVDTTSGEIVTDEVAYETNEIKSSNARKIVRLDRFCNYYQPLYAGREVSLLFHTFTRANCANLTFSRMLDDVKYAYRSISRPVRGYIWTAEVSQQLHWHYHLCVAVDRLKVRKIPDELKFEELWGQRTGVEFVRKNVKHYMAKYFAKENARVIGQRAFGCSRSLK